jgi:hypothetical protein
LSEGPRAELYRRGADAAIRPDDNAVDTLLRFVQLLFAMAFQLRAALIALDRLVELDLPGFKAAHDLLEFGEGVLETHCSNIATTNRIAHLRLSQQKG